MIEQPNKEVSYVCKDCGHTWRALIKDVQVPCPNCGSENTFFRDLKEVRKKDED